MYTHICTCVILHLLTSCLAGWLASKLAGQQADDQSEQTSNTSIKVEYVNVFFEVSFKERPVTELLNVAYKLDGPEYD